MLIFTLLQHTKSLCTFVCSAHHYKRDQYNSDKVFVTAYTYMQQEWCDCFGWSCHVRWLSLKLPELNDFHYIEWKLFSSKSFRVIGRLYSAEKLHIEHAHSADVWRAVTHLLLSLLFLVLVWHCSLVAESPACLRQIDMIWCQQRYKIINCPNSCEGSQGSIPAVSFEWLLWSNSEEVHETILVCTIM